MTIQKALRCVLVLVAAATVGGCATVPDDSSVVEKLDTETGLTVARLGRPIEVFRETFMKDPAGRFTYVAPFETNQMGSRELFLWVAVPIELREQDGPPIVSVNGQELTLSAPGKSPEFAGLRKSPYKVPTPWSTMFYFRIDQDIANKLGEANALSVRVIEPTREGTVKTIFAATITNDARLKDFAAR